MEPTPAERIRAESRKATRRALLEAGLAETIERGGDIPSVDAIVSRAGYTRGAFYFYFDDREQFVGEMLEWVLMSILTALTLTAADDAGILEVVRRFTTATATHDWPEVHGDIRAAYLAVLRELRPDTELRARHSELMSGVMTQLEVLVKEGQRAGSVRKDVEASAVAALLLLTAIGAIVWDDSGIPVDEQALGETVLRLLGPT